MPVHLEDSPKNYRAAFYTCPAAKALDMAQASWREAHEAEAERAREKHRDIEAGMRWFTYRPEEGQPRIDPEGMVYS